MSELFLIYLSFIFGCMFLVMVFNCTVKKSILDKLMIIFTIHAIIFVVWLYWFMFLKIEILNLF